MFNRDFAIDTIIDNDLNTIFESKAEYNDESLLAQMLYSGFKGYQFYSDDQLKKELKERGIEEGFAIWLI